jgi:alpha-amylase
LGEFDQKNTTRTKWGSHDDLMNLVTVAKEKQMEIYFDAVLNHKAGADETEKCRAIMCDANGLLR